MWLGPIAAQGQVGIVVTNFIKIVVGGRQDRETGTGDRRTRNQRDEAGIIVGGRQDRETGTGDRQTRNQRDEAGIIVGGRQDRETGTGDRRMGSRGTRRGS